MLPEAPAPPHRNARRPPCSLAKRGGGNDFPPPRKFAQGGDILAQDSLLLPYLPAAAGEGFHKNNRAVQSRRMNCAIAPRFLTSCLPASFIIRLSLWGVR